MAKRQFSITAARKRRADRAAALAEIAEGRLHLTVVIREPPRALLGTDLYDVLMRCPGLGKETTRTVCERASVWPHTLVGELTAAQQSAVILALPPRLQLEE